MKAKIFTWAKSSVRCYAIVVRAANPFFKRGNSSNGGVFASNNNNGNSNDNNTSRAVVVCAAGLLCVYLGGDVFTEASD